MMGALAATFEGRSLRVRALDGKPCVEARELAAVLQYQDPRDLTEMVTGRGSEFVEGVDFTMLTNGRLAAWKRDWSVGDGSVDRAPALLILFEPGMYLAAVKARTKVGKRVRRWLASEVLPQLRATGTVTLPSTPRQAPPAKLPPAAPAPEAPAPLTFQVPADLADLVRWVAKATGSTPEAVLTEALGAWGREASYLRRTRSSPSEIHTERVILVHVGESAWEALAGLATSMGAVATPEARATAAALVLNGLAGVAIGFGLSPSRRS